MAEQNAPSGEKILIRLAELAERSRKPKRPAPEPLVRTRPGAPPVPVRQTPLTEKAPAAATDAPTPRRRGAQKAPTKVQISIRLDPDVLAALKAGGRGWQSRLNVALRDMLQLGDETDVQNRCLPSQEGQVEADETVDAEEPSRPQTVVSIHPFLGETRREKTGQRH